jgi:hypothetical protein
MNLKELIKKRNLIPLSLFFSLMPSVYAYNGYTGGAFSSLAQLIRDLLQGIAEILSPFVETGFWTGAYGDVYARILIGIILGIFIYLGSKKIKIVSESEKPNKIAGILAGVIAFGGAVAMPQDIVQWTFQTLGIGAFIGLIALLLLLLKGESRIIWALKGAVFLTLFVAINNLGSRIGYGEISGMAIGLGGLITAIAGFYYLGKAIFTGAGKFGEKAGEYVSRAPEAREAIRDLRKRWGEAGPSELERAEKAEKEAEKKSKKTLSKMEKLLFKDDQQVSDLNKLIVIIKEIEKAKDKLTQEDLTKIFNRISGILTDIYNNQSSKKEIDDLMDSEKEVLGEIGIANEEELIKNIENILESPYVNEGTKTNLKSYFDTAKSRILIRNNTLKELMNETNGLKKQNENKNEEFLTTLNSISHSLSEGDYKKAIVNCIKAIENRKELMALKEKLISRINSLKNESGEIEKTMEKVGTSINAAVNQIKIAEKREGTFYGLFNEYMKQVKKKKINFGWTFFINWMKEKKLGSNVKEISQNLGIPEGEIAATFEKEYKKYKG